MGNRFLQRRRRTHLTSCGGHNDAINHKLPSAFPGLLSECDALILFFGATVPCDEVSLPVLSVHGFERRVLCNGGVAGYAAECLCGGDGGRASSSVDAYRVTQHYLLFAAHTAGLVVLLLGACCANAVAVGSDQHKKIIMQAK